MLLLATSYAQRGDVICQIQGEAKKNVMPDKAGFNIYVNTHGKTEQDCYQKMLEVSLKLLKKLKEEGFDEQQVKLTSSSIDVNYVYENNSNKKDGFNASQSYTIKFNLDKDKILKIYSSISSLQTASITLNSFTECSDELKKKIQLELMEAAFFDAKEKAKVMAKLHNLEEIKTHLINYKYGTDHNIPQEPRVFNTAQAFKMADGNSNNASFFSIAEVEFNEQVKVYFILK